MRIDSMLQNLITNNQNASSILDRVNVGDIVRAQILEITTDEILLKLFDGSTINASSADSTENLDVKRGDFVDFKIKDKLGNKLFLETLKNPLGKAVDNSEDLSKQVKALGVTADSTNLEIARELKNNNIQINKGNFDKIIDIMTSFKGISPAKAVFLIANKLGIEEKNISALNQFVDEKVKISQSIDKVMNFIESIDDDTIIRNIYNKLQPGGSSENTQKLDLKLLNLEQQNVNQVVNEKVINEIENLIKSANAVKAQGSDALTSNDLKILEKLNSFLTYNKNSTENLGEKFIRFIQGNIINNGSTPEGLQGVVQRLAEKVLSDLSNTDNVHFSKPEELKKEIGKIFDTIHVNLQSDNLKDELNIKETYKDLYSKLEIIKESINSSTLHGKSDIVSHMENTENNIRFMNQLNNYNTYVQIPINMWDRNTTGELYVLKRDKKKRKIDPDNATMLISLNTENLGQVDTFIGVSKKNISVSMRVEENRVIDFIKGYHKELYERMREKGYKLVDFKFRIPEEDINLTNVDQIAEKEFNPGKVSIDYRL